MSNKDKLINSHLCQHLRYRRECFRCQMQAFLCVNEYGGKLPHVDNDACRVIFHHLRIMVFEDILARRAATAGARYRAVKITFNSMYGFMSNFNDNETPLRERKAPPLIQPYRESTLNPLEELREIENRRKSIKKQERRARQHQNRRRK